MKTITQPLVIMPLRIASFSALSLFAAFFAVAVSPLSADSASQTLTAYNDAYVFGGTTNEGTAFGSGQTIQMAGRTLAGARKTYLGFDLSSVDASETFGSASALTFTFSQYNATGAPLIGSANGSIKINVFAIVDNTALFNQSTITWKNAPKNVTGSVHDFSTEGVTSLGSFLIDSTKATMGDSITVTGTELTGLADFLNWAVGKKDDFYNTGATQANGKKITLLFSVDSTNSGNSYPGFVFYSTEAGASLAPKLTLSSIPEPATAASIAGVIILAAAIFWRKRTS